MMKRGFATRRTSARINDGVDTSLEYKVDRVAEMLEMLEQTPRGESAGWHSEYEESDRRIPPLRIDTGNNPGVYEKLHGSLLSSNHLLKHRFECDSPDSRALLSALHGEEFATAMDGPEAANVFETEHCRFGDPEDDGVQLTLLRRCAQSESGDMLRDEMILLVALREPESGLTRFDRFSVDGLRTFEIRYITSGNGIETMDLKLLELLLEIDIDSVAERFGLESNPIPENLLALEED